MIDKLITLLIELLSIPISSAVCLGVHVSFQYKWSIIDNDFEWSMIFGRLARTLDQLLPEFITKPFYKCPPCMSTVWTPIVWFYFLNLPFDPMFFAAWIGTAGINNLISSNLEL